MLSPVYAIKATATGDISLKPDETSNAYVAWSVPREGAYMATPIVYGDLLYNIRWNGILLCYEAASGKRLYQERLGSGTTAFTASPVAGDGKIYLSSEDGDVFVVKAGPTFALVAKNPMGDVCMASPAIAAGTIGAILGAPLMLSTLSLSLMSVAVLKRRGIKGHLTPEKTGLKRDLDFFLMAFLLAFVAMFVPHGDGWVRGALAFVMVLIYFVYVMLTLRASSKPPTACSGDI